MTLKGIHCKDKSTNHHLHSKFQAFWSETERNLGVTSAEIDRFLSTIEAHKSDKQYKMQQA